MAEVSNDLICGVLNPVQPGVAEITARNAGQPVLSGPLPDGARATILEFFAAELSNDHTRRAYSIAARTFFTFCGGMSGGDRLETLSPLHVSVWLDSMKANGLAIPTIKARLAAIRHMLQYIAKSGLIRFNPASVVRGPKHSAKRGKTPVLAPDEARLLLDAIDVSTIVGLRDRALIATMVYSFARIGAVVGLQVKDVFTQNRRLWLRLHEKGGNSIDVPCHHLLEGYLSAYIDAAGIGDSPDAPLFQAFRWVDIAHPASHDGETGVKVPQQDGSPPTTASRHSRKATRGLSGSSLSQPVAWEMVQRRARNAGIATAACNHTFRATGITAYLKNGGTLERAAVIAGHKSTRTTQLYDRRPDDVTLDEIERISL